MRSSRILERKMFFSNQTGEVPIYKRDDDDNIVYYTDSDGNKIPLFEDGTEIGYSIPEELYGNIAFNGGEVESREFGLSISDYDASLVTTLNAYPINETSIIWFESEVKFKDKDKTIVDEKTADFRVRAVRPSINVSKYLLERITHG